MPIKYIFDKYERTFVNPLYGINILNFGGSSKIDLL